MQNQTDENVIETKKTDEKPQVSKHGVPVDCHEKDIDVALDNTPDTKNIEVKKLNFLYIKNITIHKYNS